MTPDSADTTGSFPLLPYRLSIKAVIRDAAGHVLLLRRSAASRNHPGMWELPGGKLEAGDNGVEEALLREVLEETGLEIRLDRVAGAAQSQAEKYRIAYLFFAAGLVEGETIAPPITLSEEHSASRWVRPDEVNMEGLVPQFREVVAALR